MPPLGSSPISLSCARLTWARHVPFTADTVHMGAHFCLLTWKQVPQGDSLLSQTPVAVALMDTHYWNSQKSSAPGPSVRSRQLVKECQVTCLQCSPRLCKHQPLFLVAQGPSWSSPTTRCQGPLFCARDVENRLFRQEQAARSL